MTRTVLYYIAGALFALGAAASGIGQQWVMTGAFTAIAAAFLVVAIRSQRSQRR